MKQYKIKKIKPNIIKYNNNNLQKQKCNIKIIFFRNLSYLQIINHTTENYFNTKIFKTKRVKKSR